MLVRRGGSSLAAEAEQLLERLPAVLASHVSGETHAAAIELASSPHDNVEDAGREALLLRRTLRGILRERGLDAAAAGTHPSALWSDVEVSNGARHQLVYESMRELARREPTFALHVHVGVADPETAVELAAHLRGHLPLLLALSGNSPFWQGRDTGLNSARTPIFHAFPRVGIPRAFESYAQYVAVVERLVRAGAFPDPTFLWWDVRLQPRFGTVEVRIMDSQVTVERATALAALIQSIAHLELTRDERGSDSGRTVSDPEVLEENRFLAFRDGIDASFIDPSAGTRVPARVLVAALIAEAREHAEELGCERALEAVAELAEDPGAGWQRRTAARSGLDGLVVSLCDRFES